MSDPSSQPTQPLTDEALAVMRGRHELEWIEPPDRVIGDFDTPWCRECGEQHPCEVARALDEVDRLRAENTAQADRIAAVGSLARNWSNASHEAKAGIDQVLQESYGTTAIAECGRALLRALGLDQDGKGQANA